MHRVLFWMGPVVILIAFAAARADDSKPPGEPPKVPESAKSPAVQLKALEKEYIGAQQEYLKAMREAETPGDRKNAIEEKRPDPLKYAARFLKLAREYPKDPAAVDALVWVCQTAYKGTPDRATALEILIKDHVKSEKLSVLCLNLGRGPDEEQALQTILKENLHHQVQGAACYALANALAARANSGNGGGDLKKEAEQLFERALKDYADVKVGRTKIGGLAKPELYELRHLSVGNTAPDIEGEDIDGKTFKLSDYRGKVVLLDFWGNW